MSDAWLPLVICATAAFVLLFVMQRLHTADLKGLAPWLEAAAGLFAVAFMLAAGVYARSTFIGRDLVPWFIRLGKGAVLVTLAAAMIAFVVVIMAVLPGRWSPIAVSTGVLLIVLVGPSVLPLLPDYRVVQIMQAGTDKASEIALRLSGRWLT